MKFLAYLHDSTYKFRSGPVIKLKNDSKAQIKVHVRTYRDKFKAEMKLRCRSESVLEVFTQLEQVVDMDNPTQVKRLASVFGPRTKEDRNKTPPRTLILQPVVVVIEEKVKDKSPLPIAVAQPDKWTIDDKKYNKKLRPHQTQISLTDDSPKIKEIICSRTGTVRGMKNKVKLSLAAFTQHHQLNTQSDEKVREVVMEERGRVVIYTTSNGIVRKTFHRCLRIKTILATQMVPMEERDIFLQSEYQEELNRRLKTSRYAYYQYSDLQWTDSQEDEEDERLNGGCEGVMVPQLFVDGRHLGGAARIEALNDSGHLKAILQPFKSTSANRVCVYCGNYRLLVCPICQGSKKSPKHNDLRRSRKSLATYVALRCTNCDDNGLVTCDKCKQSSNI